MRKWLIELRAKRGITQNAMSKLLKISQSYYAQIETGDRQIDLNLSTASKLSDIFNIPLSTIRNYEEELRRTEHERIKDF